jgi:hypothetical protein
MLAVGHQLLWTAAYGGDPPRLGGNLGGALAPGLESAVLHAVAFLSSLVTGTLVGALVGGGLGDRTPATDLTRHIRNANPAKRRTYEEHAKAGVPGRHRVPVGDDGPVRGHSTEDVHGLPERLRRPARIARARDGFLERQGTERFFPPLGFLSWVFGAASLVLCWRVKAARWWILFSQAMLVCDTSR